MRKHRISFDEKSYLINCVQSNCRVDGRRRMDFRPIEIDTNVVLTAMGSARIRMGGNEVTVSVKGDMDTPLGSAPDCGILQFSMDCASLELSQNGGYFSNELIEETVAILSDTYSQRNIIKQFCIIPSKHCWKLYIDIFVSSYDGNVYDPISLGIKAALGTAKFPSVKIVELDAERRDVELSNETSTSWSPEVSNVPVFVLLRRMGGSLLVDTSFEEEQCCSFSYIAAIHESGRILSGFKTGSGSINLDNFNDLLKVAMKVGLKLHSSLKQGITLKS